MISWVALIVAVIALVGLVLHSFLSDDRNGGVAHVRNPINERLAAMFDVFKPAVATAAQANAAVTDVSFVPAPVRASDTLTNPWTPSTPIETAGFA